MRNHRARLQGQLVEPPPHQAGQRVGRLSGLRTGARSGQRPCELEGVERISLRGAIGAAVSGRRECECLLVEQRVYLAGAERPDVDARHLRGVEIGEDRGHRSRVVAPHRRDHDHGLRAKAPQRKAQDAAGRLVEPAGVVDANRQGPCGGGGPDHLEHAEREGQRLNGLTLDVGPHERCLERKQLRTGQALGRGIDQVAEKVTQPDEGKLRLRLGRTRRHDAVAPCARDLEGLVPQKPSCRFPPRRGSARHERRDRRGRPRPAGARARDR